MKLSFGDDALEVSSNHVQVTKNDGSLTNQEAVNQLVVDEMLQLRARIEWLEGKHGIIKLPDGYIMADLHIFEANGVANAYLPIPNDTAPTFVAINGEEVDPIQGPYQLMDGDLLYAIFDWDNGNFKQLKWIKDIQQFGLNTRTGKRNQLADGEYAFRYMNAASPEALKYLDTSNLESTKQMFFHADVMDVDLGDWDVSNVMDFYQMFNYAAAFNQDVSSWVTKNVEYRGMNGMFKNATAFNQDLTQWCVPGEWEAPLDFATSSGLAAGNYPVWGTCPRYENIAPFSEADMHIFETNAADEFKLPIRYSDEPLYLEINGVQVDLTRRMRTAKVRLRDTPLYDEYLANPTEITRYEEIMDEGPDGGTPSGTFTEIIEEVDHPGVFADLDISADEVADALDNLVEVRTIPIQLQNGDIVKGIFDYANGSAEDMVWVKDIKQFGSRGDDTYYTESYDGLPDGYVPPPKLPSGRTPNQVDSVRYMLKNSTAVTVTALADLDISNLSSLYCLGNSWANGNDPGILNWDVSKVKDLSYCFAGMTSFNQDIGTHWSPDSVENLSYFFGSKYTAGANPVTDLGKWNPQNLKSMASLFDGKTSVGNNIAHWDVSKVTTMYALFRSVNFNHDISHWDTSNCTSLGAMFESNTVFNQDLSGWDTSKVTSFALMFYAATACNFDLSGWNTSSATSLATMFAGAPGFATVNMDLSNWDVSKVSTFSALFQNAGDHASRLINGSGINTWDTRSGVRFASTFGGAWRPSAVPDITGWNTGKATDMDRMFKYCYTFNQDLTGWCTTQLSTSPPDEFALNNTTWPSSSYPVWGTCPGEEDRLTYPYDVTETFTVEESWMHRFVTDGNDGQPIQLPIYPDDNWSENFITIHKPGDGEYERRVARKQDTYDSPMYIDPVPAGTVVSFFGRWCVYPWWQTYSSTPEIVDISHIQDVLQWGASYNGYSPSNSTEFTENAIFLPYAFYGTSMDVCTAGLSNLNLDADSYFDWYTSGDKDARYMFAESDFNSPDIADMDFGIDPNLEGMFMNNTKFNQDLTGWCVPWATEEPTNFSTGATALEEANKPLWGTCAGSKPTLEQIETQVAKLLTQDGRELLDCHVFVCNGNDVKLPIPPDEEASWIAVNGVECEDYSNISVEDGDYIHAIFDWNVAGSAVGYSADWFSDILQIGLCLETDTRNQLKSGFCAFQYMTANPAVLADLDTSNLTDTSHMFSFAESFNQDISGWDVSQVSIMMEMFLNATAFDQDLKGWCVELIASEPTRFAMNSGFELDTAKHPVWGTCGGDPDPDGGGTEEPGEPGDIDP